MIDIISIPTSKNTGHIIVEYLNIDNEVENGAWYYYHRKNGYFVVTDRYGNIYFIVITDSYTEFFNSVNSYILRNS
jgi:hypothetical protein